MQHAGNKPLGCPASEQWSCDATGKCFKQRDSTSLLGNWAESGKEWNQQSKVTLLVLSVPTPQAMVLPGIFHKKNLQHKIKKEGNNRERNYCLLT